MSTTAPATSQVSTAESVARAKMFLDAHRGPVAPTLQAIADAAGGCSPFALHRAFKAATGVTLRHYVMSRGCTC